MASVSMLWFLKSRLLMWNSISVTRDFTLNRDFTVYMYISTTRVFSSPAKRRKQLIFFAPKLKSQIFRDCQFAKANNYFPIMIPYFMLGSLLSHYNSLIGPAGRQTSFARFAFPDWRSPRRQKSFSHCRELMTRSQNISPSFPNANEP